MGSAEPAEPSRSVAFRLARCGWVGSVLVVLAFAAPAHADPRALARSAGVLAIAPGGDQVLVARARGAHLRVVSIPLTGGAARPVFSFDAPKALLPRRGLAVRVGAAGRPDP